MLKINGENADGAIGMTLEAYLASKGFDSSRLAVERNGEIVPKASYSQVVLKDGDSVEIVRFVGGG